LTQTPTDMKKIWFFSLIALTVLFSSCGTSKKTVHRKKESEIKTRQTDAQTKRYIARFKKTAQREMRQYNIPASITLAQGILESASGTSYLARVANNHFGIKCGDDWDGPKVYKDDDHKNECFRKYKTPDESYRDHSLFLVNRKRYAFLFRFSPSDYEAWAKGLKKAGYATDPGYPSKLIYLIEKYDLHQLDKEVLEQMKVKTREPEPTEQKEDAQKVIYEVKAGETLYTIAKKFGIPVSEIKEMNNLVDYDIYEGQILVLKLPKDKLQRVEENTSEENEITPDEEQLVQANQQANGEKISEEKEKVQAEKQAESPHEPQKPESMENETRQEAGISNRHEAEENKTTSGDKSEEYVYHTVMPKETLYAISKKYGVPIEKIKAANGMNDNVLHVGQVIKIPVGSPGVEKPAVSTEIPAYHIVKKGETLYRIHVKYGVPIEKLRELNNLPDNTIYPGQKIRLR